MIQERRSLRFRIIVLAALAGFLVWQVISRSLVAYLAILAPESAVGLRPTDSTALLNLALRALNRDRARDNLTPAGDANSNLASQDTSDASEDARPSPAVERFAFKPSSEIHGADQAGQREEPSSPPALSRSLDPQVRVWAELALVNEPLNARAFRILGQLAENASDVARAATLMRAAAQRSNRESVAIHWLMRDSFEKQDYASALYYADTLFRTRRNVLAYVMPTLAGIAENKDASGELKKLLAGDPPWRREFFAAVPNAISDARTPLDLFLSIKDTPAPPTSVDLRGYLNFLIGRNLHELAYYVWLQFLSSEQLASAGFLFNGGFEITPSGLPFDWGIVPGSGVTIDIVALPEQDDQHALFVEFGHGRVEFGGVTQMTMLAPGSYEFEGRYKGEIVGRRGLDWRISCAGSKETPLGKSAMLTGTTPAWKDIKFSFTVPDTNCRAQNLWLNLDARSASEQLVSGFMWYDELRISRT